MNRYTLGAAVIFLALLMSGAFTLDPLDPEAPTADLVQDANEQDAKCAANQHTCEQDAQEAAKDPRVQATLRRMCASGQKWACGLVKSNLL